MEMDMENDNDESVINMKEATELRLGLPGTHDDDHQMAAAYKMNHKRASPEAEEIITTNINNIQNISSSPPPKVQIVGWPPVKSYRKSTNVMMRKTTMTTTTTKKTTTSEGSDHQMYYVKVSMDGAAYLRKVDLKVYNGYSELFKALETMFKLTIAEYAPAYQDKDGDLMLVGDVPWQMFMQSCKRLRIMKGADARGLGATAL